MSGKREFSLCLAKKQDISCTDMPEELMILLSVPSRKLQKDSAWRQPLMMTLFLWSRYSRFYWNSVMYWQQECGEKERNAPVFL